MHDLDGATLGETWVRLVRRTVQAGAPMGDEGLELLGVEVGFPAAGAGGPGDAAGDCGGDPLLARFGDRQMIAEMQRVFFADGPNGLGHSYARLMRGPGGRQDLEDVIALLRAEPGSKRAVVTFCGEGDGKVPCINAVQFLVRDGAVRTMYFARGQDAYQKFYADALCLAALARKVAAGLGVPAGRVTGFLGSSHVYHRDLPAIRAMLAAVPEAGEGGR